MSQPNWNVQVALRSTRSLSDILGEMSEEECMQALEVEASTRRRSVILDRLINKVADIRRQNALAQLKEKFHHATH